MGCILSIYTCPACGGAARIGTIKDDHAPCVYYSVECPCGYHGPKEATKKEAVIQHNSMQRALTWTTYTPKESGSYWCRYKADGDTAWSVPYVTAITNLSQYVVGEKHHVEWAGPIPTPKEPTA